MKSLIIIFSVIIIFLLVYLIITKKRPNKEKIIDAEYEDLDKKK